MASESAEPIERCTAKRRDARQPGVPVRGMPARSEDCRRCLAIPTGVLEWWRAASASEWTGHSQSVIATRNSPLPRRRERGTSNGSDSDGRVPG